MKKRLLEKCFLVKFAKFLRTPILKNIYERLLLFHVSFKWLKVRGSKCEKNLLGKEFAR